MRWIRHSGFFLWFGLAACEVQPGAKAIGFDEIRSVQRPAIASLSPDGSRLAYVVRDSLWIQRVGEDAVPVLDGMSAEAEFAIPWVAWSSDGARLAIRTTTDAYGLPGGGRGAPVIVDLRRGVTVSPLLPDSLREAISMFRSFLTGPPAWAPDGAKLAFVGLEPDGDDPSRTFVYVVDLAPRTVTRIDAGTSEPYNVTWSPDGSWLIYTRGAFRGTDGAVVVHAADDVTREPTVYAGGASLYRAPMWFPDRTTVMVRDLRGAPTVLQLSSSGTLSEVPASLPPRSYAGFTSDGKALVATVQNGMASKIVRVDLRTGLEQEVRADGPLYDVIGVIHGDAGDRVVYTAESGSVPAVIWTAPIDADGSLGMPEVLSQINAGADETRFASSQVYRWRTADGAELEAQLFIPREAATGLPLVVMPYGSYQNAFPGSDYFLNVGIHPLAMSGYAVVRPNTRGFASEQQVDGRYGATQLSDTRDLIAALVEDGIVDPERIVALGHSHGGAMVYYYLTHSDLFAGAVAVNGAADWIYQAGLFQMVGLPNGMGGAPEDLPEKYDEFSPLAQFRRVQAPLLALTGALDTQIPESQSQAIVDSLQAIGRDAQWISFPDEGHLINREANRRRLWEEIFSFIARVTGGAEVRP
jgi:dipeptidyl aminopeptidase/acylaminoacyl peptidase